MARVLVVDDAKIMRNILQTMLEKGGHEVVACAESGEEALIQYDDLKPDLVTLDILMKGVDGMECLKSICSRDPSAKVVMVTAQGHGQKHEEALAEGAAGYVAKPVDPEHLLAEIDRIMAS